MKSLCALMCGFALLSCSGPRSVARYPHPQGVFTGAGAVLPVQEPLSQSEIPQLAKGDTSVPIGVGFTLDPDTVMFNGAADFQLNRMMSMGVSLPFGASDKRFLFAPTVQIKTFLNAMDATAEPSRWQPYLQGGLGWAWLDSDRAADGSSFNDNSFLLNGGGGIRYRLNRNYSIGSGALINFVPNKIDDDRWFFSWEVLQLVFHF